MPQPLRQTIGFDQVSLDKLRAITSKTNHSQRDVVCALLSLDEDQIIAIANQFIGDENSAKALNRQKVKDAIKVKNQAIAEIKKQLLKMSPEELANVKVSKLVVVPAA